MPPAITALGGLTPTAGTVGAADRYALAAGDQLSRILPAALVYVETAPGSNTFALQPHIDWNAVTIGIDGADNTANLSVKFDTPRTFAEVLATLTPNRKVRVAVPVGADGHRVLFEGFPMPRTFGWSSQGRHFDVTCLSEGQELLRHRARSQIFTRFMRSNPIEAWSAARPQKIKPVASLPLVFNPKGRGNRSDESLPFDMDDGAFKLHLFTDDGAPDAAPWRFVDALRYLSVMHVLNDDLGPPISVVEFLRDTEALVERGVVADSPDPFVARITAEIADVSVQSLNVEEAIAVLCEQAGLHYQIRTVSDAEPDATTAARYVLRIFATLETSEQEQASPTRQMITPRLHAIAKETPWTDQAGRTPMDIALRNRAHSAQITMDPRIINRPVYVGGADEYEVTVLLRPGWAPHFNLDNVVQTEEGVNAALDFWVARLGAADEFNEDTGVPTSEYHGKHPNFGSLQYNTGGVPWPVRDVFRLWVFPDDHRYLLAGIFARQLYPAKWYDPFDHDPLSPEPKPIWAHRAMGANLPEASLTWVIRRRPFGNRITRRDAASDRSPTVWIHYNAPNPDTALTTPGWVPFAGQALIDPDRAAIWFAEDNFLLSMNMQEDPKVEDETACALFSYLNNSLAIAITATVVGDDRMLAFPEPPSNTLRARVAMRDLGFETFRQRSLEGQRDPNRLGYPDWVEDDPEYDERDDTQAFTRRAEKVAAQHAVEITAGNFEVPWLEQDYLPGDSFFGCPGEGIQFVSAPEIVTIEYTNAPKSGQRTVFHLSDLRHAPEVGADV